MARRRLQRKTGRQRAELLAREGAHQERLRGHEGPAQRGAQGRQRRASSPLEQLDPHAKLRPRARTAAPPAGALRGSPAEGPRLRRVALPRGRLRPKGRGWKARRPRQLPPRRGPRGGAAAPAVDPDGAGGCSMVHHGPHLVVVSDRATLGLLGHLAAGLRGQLNQQVQLAPIPRTSRPPEYSSGLRIHVLAAVALAPSPEPCPIV